MKYIKPPDFKSVKEFTEYYAKIENDITRLLTKDASAKSSEELNMHLQKALNAAVSYLGNINKRFTNEELPKAFQEGKDGVKGAVKLTQEQASAILEKQGFKYAKNAFSRNAYIELQTAVKGAGNGLKSRVNKIIEQLRKENKDSVYNVQQAILKDLQDNGILTVAYANGAKQPLSSYAAMAARSARIESVNIGAIGRALQAGTDYVEMTKMPQCCKYCGAYQGKVYCISGKDKRFPALFKTVLKSGYALPHPNCRHEFIPWFEDMESAEDVKKAIESSKIKYDKHGNLVDVRYQKDIELYAAWQAGNRQLNAEAKEYAEMQSYYKANGKEPPYKTLGAFRRARRADELSPAFKAWRYRNVDGKQYEEWKSVIGEKNMPETLAKFQEIKYNKNNEQYALLNLSFNDAKIRSRIGSDEFPLKVHEDRQGKHISTAKTFDKTKNKSFLAVCDNKKALEFSQKIIDKYHGKGELQHDIRNEWKHTELIEANEIIGFVEDIDGVLRETNRAIIHYSKTGAHIVPTLRSFNHERK